MQRSSLQDSDGTIWSTASLKLGTHGLDLRLPSDQPAFADLLNVRFPSERGLQRRNGYVGASLIDGDVYPAIGNIAPGDWLYGHGHKISGSLAPNAHYPEAHTARQSFELDGQRVVWTGDRLLILRDGNTALGSSTFWLRASDAAIGRTSALPRGIPAHLPLATDTPAPASLGGPDFLDTCLTASLRVYVTIKSNVVTLTTIDRETKQIVSSTNVTGTATTPVEPMLIAVGGTTPVLMFRDTADSKIRVRIFTGNGWTAEDFVGADTAAAYDAVDSGDSFTVVWRNGTALKCVTYVGTRSGAVVTLNPTHAPSGNIAAAWSASEGAIGVMYLSGTSSYFEAFVDGVSTGLVKSLDTGSTIRCYSVAARALSDNSGGATAEWITYLHDTSGVLVVNSFSAANTGLTTVTRCNVDVVSRAFIVGDEVFIWLRSQNSDSCFLLCGAGVPYVVGWADREIGVTPSVPGAWNYWPVPVHSDPSDARGLTRTWVRCFNTNDTAREGNVMVGDLDFLPQLYVAKYGKSLYTSGSCVKNWDGRSLSDAGFGDYPKAVATADSAGGSLTVGGKYQWRVYAVRYNDKGERFESAAVTSAVWTMTSTHRTASVQISYVPAVSADDVILEIYRTADITSGGTGFYLEGTVANNPAASTTTWTSTIDDATLITRVGDPHAPIPGLLADLETFAPLGCAVLATVSDRLWGAGGQVPEGQAQYSKLAVNGFGAGFDDLAGYVVLSNEGGAITSLSALNDATVVLAEDRIFVLGGDGPDNYGQGGYSVPRLILAAGATTHAGTILTPMGVGYWGVGGPMLLTPAFDTVPIGAPVKPLAVDLTPVAVQIDTARQEVVWFCGADALLVNYMAEPRWSRWELPEIAGGDDLQLVTSGGRVLTESATAPGDDGVPFTFLLRTGDISPESMRQGHTLARVVGVVGSHDGEHQVRFRVYYNGAAQCMEEAIWQPDTGTYLNSVANYLTMTPAQVDAISLSNRSGQYETHKRLKRQDCHHFAIELSDISSWSPTFTPYELSIELGMKPGLGRTVINTFD